MIKAAIIGCGRISERHIQSINAHPELRLAAVCDLDLQKMGRVSKEQGVNGYQNYVEMFAFEEIDLISVCVEAGYHARIVCEVAEYGKHIIVEKPMALRLEDADRMIEACDRNGVKLFVVKQNRFNLPVIKLKEALDAARFGKLILGTIRLRWARHQQYFDMDKWRGTWALDGGVFASQASHHVDMLRWLMGPVKSVQAVGRNMLLPGIEVEDTGIAVLEFVNGALGIIEATNAARPDNIEGSVSILGSKGTVVIGGKSMNHIDIWKFEDGWKPEDLGKYNENPPDIYGYGHKRFYEHVVDNLNGVGSNIIGGLEGRKALELICAIYESIMQDKKVTVNFFPEKLKLGIL